MILITSAAGYIGQALMAKLRASDIPYLATDRNRLNTGAQKQPPIDCLDVTDESAWMRYFETHQGIDTIVHLAAESYIDRCAAQPQAALQTNVGSVELLLRAATAAQVRHIIFPSSFTVYGPHNADIAEDSPLEPGSFYAHMKAWAESLLLQAAKNSPLQVTIFRQSNICGLGPVAKPTVVQTLVKRWLQKQPITIFGDGRQTKNFLDIRDCVNAYEMAIQQQPAGIFNLGGPSTLSIAALAQAINAIGRQQPHGYEVPITYEPARRDGVEPSTLHWTSHASKLERALGFVAQYRVEDTIATLMAALSGRAQ